MLFMLKVINEKDAITYSTQKTCAKKTSTMTKQFEVEPLTQLYRALL